MRYGPTASVLLRAGRREGSILHSHYYAPDRSARIIGYAQPDCAPRELGSAQLLSPACFLSMPGTFFFQKLLHFSSSPSAQLPDILRFMKSLRWSVSEIRSRRPTPWVSRDVSENETFLPPCSALALPLSKCRFQQSPKSFIIRALN